jgi:hypothetical protein
MRDYGIDKGLVEFRDDSKRDQRGWGKGFFGFRKMFRDYLTKLNVAFYDSCCPALTGDIYPLRYNDATDVIERFNGTTWVTVTTGEGENPVFASVESPLLSTDTISPVGAMPLEFSGSTMTSMGVTPANVTATLTTNQLRSGYITSTSAAAVSLTLPDATSFATAIGAVAGTIFDFYVDNSAGANTVTVIVGSGITVNTPAITGGATLTVSTANAVGWFRLVFTSATAAKILRIA